MKNTIQGLGILAFVFSLFFLSLDYEGSIETLGYSFDVFEEPSKPETRLSGGQSIFANEGWVSRIFAETEADDQEKKPSDSGSFTQFGSRLRLLKYSFLTRLCAAGFFVQKDITIFYRNLRI